MTNDELCEYAKTISTREGFVKFVGYLAEDYENHGGEWENKKIEQFLSGLSGFANGMAGYYKNMNENVDVNNITWRIAAEMLLAATVYEG
ncbi:hypothetical protein [Pseudomonas sp. FW300-N2F2]|uniref:DUF7660 family protein n=1 Tax=Pseudomonas sp. FW300-N2F2 TaxID=2751320 RepID=UPI001A92FD5D|nr:hypothetical protein [Pseudomonas sp. FW300-N2F2]